MNRDWRNSGKETIFCGFINTSDAVCSSFYLTKIDRYIFIFKLQPPNAALQKEQQKKNTKLLVYTKKCSHHAADVFSSSLSSDFSPQCHLYLQSCAAEERITGRERGVRLEVRCVQAAVRKLLLGFSSLWKAAASLMHSSQHQGKNCRGPSSSS